MPADGAAVRPLARGGRRRARQDSHGPASSAPTFLARSRFPTVHGALDIAVRRAARAEIHWTLQQLLTNFKFRPEATPQPCYIRPYNTPSCWRSDWGGSGGTGDGAPDRSSNHTFTTVTRPARPSRSRSNTSAYSARALVKATESGQHFSSGANFSVKRTGAAVLRRSTLNRSGSNDQQQETRSSRENRERVPLWDAAAHSAAAVKEATGCDPRCPRRRLAA